MVVPATSRAYYRKYGHACDFSEKGQNIGTFRQKCTKFENILTMARMKRLEYALIRYFLLCASVLFFLLCSL